MYVSPENKAKVNAVVLATVATIEQKYNIKFAKPVEVRYDINSSRLGGQALTGRYVIRLNPHFLGKYGDEYINETVVHEVVHLGVGIRYGCVQSHGDEWRRMMWSCGVEPERCHNYKADEGVGRQKTKYAYKCSQCGEPVPVGPKIHDKIQKGVHYWPRCCGRSARLEFVATAGQVNWKVAAEIARTGDTTLPSRTITPPPNVPKMKAPNPTSKLGQCYTIFKRQQSYGFTRAQWISAFVLQAGCTPAGASTYLSTCQKLFAAGV